MWLMECLSTEWLLFSWSVKKKKTKYDSFGQSNRLKFISPSSPLFFITNKFSRSYSKIKYRNKYGFNIIIIIIYKSRIKFFKLKK